MHTFVSAFKEMDVIISGLPSLYMLIELHVYVFCVYEYSTCCGNMYVLGKTACQARVPLAAVCTVISGHHDDDDRV